MNQRKPKPDLPWLANCPNALELSVYPCKPHRGEYLLFLGRMSPDKGCHRAIAVAMELELPEQFEVAARLRDLHNGGIGDSVTWLVVGIAAFGTLLAVVVR
jgi:glycosyltransferase involved in cell wall biosynthesis